jgi:hypothetical protein
MKDQSDPKTLYRLVVATQGLPWTTPDELIVRFEKRSHNPILREAAMDREPTTIAWLGGRRIRFVFDTRFLCTLGGPPQKSR